MSIEQKKGKQNERLTRSEGSEAKKETHSLLVGLRFPVTTQTNNLQAKGNVKEGERNEPQPPMQRERAPPYGAKPHCCHSSLFFLVRLAARTTRAGTTYEVHRHPTHKRKAPPPVSSPRRSGIGAFSICWGASTTIIP